MINESGHVLYAFGEGGLGDLGHGKIVVGRGDDQFFIWIGIAVFKAHKGDAAGGVWLKQSVGKFAVAAYDTCSH